MWMGGTLFMAASQLARPTCCRLSPSSQGNGKEGEGRRVTAREEERREGKMRVEEGKEGRGGTEREVE